MSSGDRLLELLEERVARTEKIKEDLGQARELVETLSGKLDSIGLEMRQLVVATEILFREGMVDAGELEAARRTLSCLEVATKAPPSVMENLPIVEAALRTLRQLRVPISTSILIEKMEENGHYKSRSKNSYMTIYRTLTRSTVAARCGLVYAEKKWSLKEWGPGTP